MLQPASAPEIRFRRSDASGRLTTETFIAVASPALNAAAVAMPGTVRHAVRDIVSCAVPERHCCRYPGSRSCGKDSPAGATKVATSGPGRRAVVHPAHAHQHPAVWGTAWATFRRGGCTPRSCLIRLQGLGGPEWTGTSAVGEIRGFRHLVPCRGPKQRRRKFRNREPARKPRDRAFGSGITARFCGRCTHGMGLPQICRTPASGRGPVSAIRKGVAQCREGKNPADAYRNGLAADRMAALRRILPANPQ